jgi:hypothetical protein
MSERTSDFRPRTSDFGSWIAGARPWRGFLAVALDSLLD